MFNAAHSETDRAKIRALPWHLAHGALTNIFFLWTFGGSVFLLFLSELGLPKAQIGIMLSLFPFCGLLALVFAPYASRIGRKRVFLTCYGSRYFVIINLLLLPWILVQGGQAAGVAFVFAIMLTVAILRALGETAYYPWSQEFIPNSVRGLYSAIFNSVGTVASAVAILIASRVIASGSGLSRFLGLIAAGTLIGFIAIIAMYWVPGGAPDQAEGHLRSHFARMAEALHDSNLTAYLKGMGCVMVGSVLLTSFLPLYVKEKIGLPAGTVVILDMVVMLGGALFSIFWGWAADHVGSRPVLMTSLGIAILLPLGWLVLPRQIANPVFWCGLFYFTFGITASGTAIGAGRLLFNGVIPPEKSTSYTAIYYACLGLTGGIAPLLAGGILSISAGKAGAFGPLIVDGYSVLFVLGSVLLFFGLIQYSHVAPDGVYTTREAIRKMVASITVRRV